MNILIVGASGLIGSNLMRQLSSHGFNLYCQSRKKQITQYNEIWIEHDLIDQDWRDLDLPKIDLVYFLAGQTSVYYADEFPSIDLSVNVLCFVRLLEYLRNFNSDTYVAYIGTATQCGISDLSLINEMVVDNPITFYDLSKLTAEKYLMQFIQQGYLKGCSFRLANVFGGSVLGQKSDRGIVDKVFKMALLGQDITIFGDGKNLRDYVYIKDVVDALVKVIGRLATTNGEVFYLSSGSSISLLDAFQAAINLAYEKTGNKVKLIHMPPPAGLSKIEERSVRIESKKIQTALSWSPKYSLEKGLRDAYMGCK